MGGRRWARGEGDARGMLRLILVFLLVLVLAAPSIRQTLCGSGGEESHAKAPRREGSEPLPAAADGLPQQIAVAQHL